MQNKRNTRFWSFILSMVLIVAMALVTTGCNGKAEAPDTQVTSEAGDDAQAGQDDDATADQDADAADDSSSDAEAQVLGEGQTTFYFTVVDGEANETKYEIHTDETTVGEALLALDLIAGDEGDYGLFVKQVNGITADYDTDGTYWAFYENGEYAMQGVDQTDITDGAEYAFKVEK